MIKCLKCNTLYSESAKVCLYCKIPLEQSLNIDENYFNFKFKEFSTEVEAQTFKASLLATEIPCAIKKENDKYIILIPESAKRNAFKPNQTSPLDEMSSKRAGKNKATIYIAVLFIFLIVCFLFYSSKTGKKLFFKDQSIDYQLVTEGGTVDPRIMEPKIINTKPKKKIKEEKEKIEKSTPR